MKMKFVVNDNSWTLKFDNFSHFQNVISNNPPLTRERHYDVLRTKIDMLLTPNRIGSVTLVSIFSGAAIKGKGIGLIVGNAMQHLAEIDELILLDTKCSK